MNLTLLFISLSALYLIGFAYLWVVTPPEKRFSPTIPKDLSKLGDDYAPLYSKQERIRSIACWSIVGLSIYALCEFWGFKALANFSEVAHCYEFYGVSGSTVLIYITFGPMIGILLGFTFVTGNDARLAIKTGQWPLPETKTLKPTRYCYGYAAIIPKILLALLLIFGLIITGWQLMNLVEIVETKTISPYKQQERQAVCTAHGLAKP